ncbi:MAG: thioether cross-link-forming SCIFF peptide maturase [Clostridia bacterium]
MQFTEDKIHLIDKGEIKILLDVNSGAVHLLDEETFAVLQTLLVNGNNWDNLPAVADLAGIRDSLAELQAQGLLLAVDDEIFPRGKQNVLKALCMNVAHDCNLNCHYCFASQGDFGGERKLMPVEVGKQAVDFLLKHSGSRTLCEMDFFGGEPLMAWPMVQEVVLYGEAEADRLGKKFHFTMTTNGVLLTTAVQNFLNQHEISTVLSLDGRKEVHDRMRPTWTDAGSYDLILPKYQEFAASRDDYVIRGTYTHFNLDFAADVLHYFKEGFKNLSMEPVIGPVSADFSLRPEDFATIEQEYDQLAEAYLELYRSGNEMNFFHFNVDLDHGPCLPKRLTGCGAGVEYFALSPEGDLYPCHQFVGREEFKVGTLATGIERTDLVQQFSEAHIYNKPLCKACWARFFCGGGCHANAEEFNQTLLTPYELGCRIQKKRLEAAIYVQIMKKLG